MKYNGILLCDKPFGVTSHDVINNIRHILGQKKIGHIGTLDPRATGLLVLCLGRATKIARFISDDIKMYQAEITLGKTSVTLDSEGISETTPKFDVPELTMEAMKDILSNFVGKILQKVPVYSAVKVKGKRLYKSARTNEKVNPPDRQVEIKRIDIVDMKLPVLKIEVLCSRGTYIRTLADDIGRLIGCGGYLSALCRMQSGNYKLEDALSLRQIEAHCNAGTLDEEIISIETALGFPRIKINDSFVPSIISGRSPAMDDVSEIIEDFETEDYVSLVNNDGRIMAVGKALTDSSELDESFEGDNFFKYVRVLN